MHVAGRKQIHVLLVVSSIWASDHIEEVNVERLRVCVGVDVFVCK